MKRKTPFADATFNKAAEWTHLSRFQVSYRQNNDDNVLAHVFRNGRQQVPISIFIEARNADNEVVTLANVDMWAIKLVDYNTGAPLPTGVVVTDSYENLYDYYPENFVAPAGYEEVDEEQVQGDAPEGSPNSSRLPSATSPRVKTYHASGRNGATIQAQERVLWLTTTSPNTLRVAASLIHNGIPFHTHSPEANPGGYPDDGNFNSSMRIEPVPPRVFRAASFTFTQHSDNPHPRIGRRTYSLSISDPSFKIRQAIEHHQLYDYGWFFAKSRGGDNCYFYAPDGVGPVTVRHQTLWEPEVSITFTANTGLASQGVANLYMLIQLDVQIESDFHNVGKMSYIDNMGNESILYLRDADAGLTMILADS